MPPHPLLVPGPWTYVLSLGWLGFNGGSQLALGSAADAITISNIYVNTTMASAGGLVTAVILKQLLSKRMDLTMALNGALGGLVSITAGPDTPGIGEAILIGAVGATLVVLVTPLLDRWKIDDVVGAIPVHLVAGIWGTLAVPLTNAEASLVIQLIGTGAIGLFVVTTSSLAWLLLKKTIGLRLSRAEEALGIDKAELGTLAYPEFRLARPVCPFPQCFLEASTIDSASAPGFFFFAGFTTPLWLVPKNDSELRPPNRALQ